MIKDSGTRREFETGAVRDIQEGKGRCDLMPLDVVGSFLNNPTLSYICKFQESGDVSYLRDALSSSGVFHDPYTMFLEVAKHFEEGAKKYSEDNWRKGINAKNYVDSGTRHYLKWLRGDKDEPHDRAFVWNITACWWTCIHKPELNDYRRGDPPVIKSEPTCATCAYNSALCPAQGGIHTCTGCPCHCGDECYCSIINDGDVCKHYKPFKEADVH